MKPYFYILFTIFLFTLFACENKDEKDKDISTDMVIGYWVNPVYTDSTITFDKATSLKENEYCFAFLEDKLFIERKNSGWCGTPPISYADYEGTWSRFESTIQITVGYWGGLNNYEWKIVNLNDKKLSVLKIK